MNYRFNDRAAAGKELAKALVKYKGQKETLILALPRGGVPIAFEVAQELELPMDVLLVRKLGVPGYEELAMGAIALGGICYLNHDLIEQLDISESAIDDVIGREKKELQRRNDLYRGDMPFPQIQGQVIIVIDDGLATGATMRAAVSALRAANAAKVVVVVPVGAPSSYSELQELADEVVCLHTPEPFYGVGQWYVNFSQTTDEEVQHLLALSHERENHYYTPSKSARRA